MAVRLGCDKNGGELKSEVQQATVKGQLNQGKAIVQRTILLAAERTALSRPVEWAGLLSSELVKSTIK